MIDCPHEVRDVASTTIYQLKFPKKTIHSVNEFFRGWEDEAAEGHHVGLDRFVSHDEKIFGDCHSYNSILVLFFDYAIVGSVGASRDGAHSVGELVLGR